MNNHLKDILSNSPTSIEPEKLIAYLNKELSPEEAQAVEEKLAADEFEQTALEGLESVQNIKHLNSIRHQLNRELQKKIKKRNQQKRKLHLHPLPLTWVVILIFLLLIAFAYWMITRMPSS